MPKWAQILLCDGPILLFIGFMVGREWWQDRRKNRRMIERIMQY